MPSRYALPVFTLNFERGAQRQRMCAAIQPSTVWKLAVPQSPTIVRSTRGRLSRCVSSAVSSWLPRRVRRASPVRDAP
jgi:hypothetical protein